MSRLLPLVFAVPLVLAAVGVPLRRSIGSSRALVLAGALWLVGAGGWLLWATRDGGVVVARMGGWPPPVAITLAGDTFASLMLCVSGFVVGATAVFAFARGEDRRPFFHPAALVLTAGVGGAYLTADLFNLFVFVEVGLAASYVLVVSGAGREEARAGVVYVVANLLASTALLAAIALLYGAAGSVNLAQLAGVGSDRGTAAVAGVMVMAALGIKASVVPAHGWLPRSYPLAGPAVTAMLSGLLTKVGVYAAYRVGSVVLGGSSGIRIPLLVVAGATMVIGVLGAVGRNSMREILSFHMVSQIGYLVMALGISGATALSAGVFFMVQYIVVKASLFLVAGAVESLEGTGELGRTPGLARRRPVLSTAFAIAALSLAGVPPLSGFVGKLGLVRAAFDAREYLMGGVAVVVSFLTLASMVKIWNGSFWGRAVRGPRGRQTSARLLVAPGLLTASLSVVLGLGAETLWALAERAGAALADPGAYVRAVSG